MFVRTGYGAARNGHDNPISRTAKSNGSVYPGDPENLERIHELMSAAELKPLSGFVVACTPRVHSHHVSGLPEMDLYRPFGGHKWVIS